MKVNRMRLVLKQMKEHLKQRENDRCHFGFYRNGEQLCICTVSPEPPILAYTKHGSIGRLRPKMRP